jgi:hypothetical protein
MFLVLEGAVDIHLRDGVVSLGPGECCVVPRGVEHKPVARPNVLALELDDLDVLAVEFRNDLGRPRFGEGCEFSREVYSFDGHVPARV